MIIDENSKKVTSKLEGGSSVSVEVEAENNITYLSFIKHDLRMRF